ncbi:hypothetical protein DICPUDRAFT_159741 [Dictyostelium purpureum]|uniref:Uncharacterized protein n=1 Tax=Dictyostelium purpureum TaxID=5786 RepID=F1A4V9_DICPU|nr:uncharacterized protein DICPUDRAFT_159741 [Dictyostelium purpureum]EGC28768.1 hypothetical protein DICPUDRAFT_159741 [Dictyostelium purpureum]|eukprot:XP_003294703.1 hypothetical protein DICPUDRAFT_159741 [Dictyostelium purpureum]
MSIIAAISSLGSVQSSSFKQTGVSNYTASSDSASFAKNNNAHLADVNIFANLLGILGIGVSAKVL